MPAYKSLGFVRVDQQEAANLERAWRRQERRLLWVGLGFILAAILVPVFAVLWLSQ
ncbi:MAG: hypothetical protein ACRD2L_16220 [Terriglobia bacterium]